MLGTSALSGGYDEACAARPDACHTSVARTSAPAFATLDFIVTPTTPTCAFELGANDDPHDLPQRLCPYRPLAGLPAISIPVRPLRRLPVGFQIVGNATSSDHGDPRRRLRAEAAIGFDGAPPEEATA